MWSKKASRHWQNRVTIAATPLLILLIHACASPSPGSSYISTGARSKGTKGVTATPTPTPIPTPLSSTTASATPTPTSTRTATPTPAATATAAAGHYSMRGPGATLPSESSCATQVNASPIAENAPWNQNDGTGYNSNVPPSGGVPSYFYQYAPCCGVMPNSDFATVDGAYAGTTDDIFRVYACKWGIDEDYIRAQAWIESGWHNDCAAAHGGTGCRVGGDENNPAGCTTGLPITPISPSGQFCGMEGFGGLTSPNQYDSWSIVQNKVYYQWMTWPMMEESTPFGVDYRYAEMRGCVNGDQYSYFNSQSSTSGSDYQNAVNAAKTNPNGASRISGWTNLQYLAYGCIDTHFSGDWFNGSTDSYLSGFLSAFNSAPWPGGNR